jgi:glycine cleavage system H protein
LTNTPELLNQDPYIKGWMFKVKMSDLPEVAELLSPSEYSNHIGA